MIKLLILIIIIIFFIYIILKLINRNKEENLELIYNKNCVLKKFRDEIKNNNLNYEIDNLLLKINFLQPIIFSLYSNNFKKRIMEIYHNKRKTEKFRFSDKYRHSHSTFVCKHRCSYLDIVVGLCM